MSASFFMAANSSQGFFSLFDEIYFPHEGWKLYIIKGGPGTGKSSLMKKIADKAVEKGYYCERVYCSSDPNSLDGVMIHDLKISVADGTSPHVIEPRYPGVSEKIINLGECWDENKLKKNAEHIITLSDCNKALHKRSSRYLSAAAASLKDNARILSTVLLDEKAENFAIRYVNRYVNCRNALGREEKRFIDAVTPEGKITLYETALSLCDTLFSISDDFAFASQNVVDKIRKYALANGADVITCLDQIDPIGNPRHVILKNERIGFFSSDSNNSFKGYATRNINAGRFVNDLMFDAHKNRIIFNKKIAESLLEESVKILSKAKSVHDELEKYYISAMNFEKINDLSNNVIEEIFG